MRDRGLRVLVLASISVVIAFVGALFAPMLLLALGPIALGVPHLLSDVRYLIARPGLHRRAPFWLLVIGPVWAAAYYGVFHAALTAACRSICRRNEAFQ